MRVAVVGSRGFSDYGLMCAVLDKIREEHGISEIVSGGAKGADTLAVQYAEDEGIKRVIFFPRFKTDKGTPYHPKWFAIRNKEIVDYCDMMVAFWDGVSRGTDGAITLCSKAGKPCHVVMV